MGELMRNVVGFSTLMLATAVLGACEMRDTFNVMTVYDGSTMDCEAAQRIAGLADDRSAMQQIALSKVSFCEATANDEGTLPVGYFDAVERHYEFRTLDVNDADAVSQLCVDLASAAGPVNSARTTYRFATEFGDFSCEELPVALLDQGAVPMVAPSHAPLHIDVDPVLVHASGANPQLRGVPKRFYDDVRDRLAELVKDYEP